MKKIISAFAALTLAAVTAASVSAEGITPKGGNPFDVTPNPSSQNTEINFSVNPDYTVTIPAQVKLTGKKGEAYKGSGTIEATGVFLKTDQKIVVSLTSASKFNLSADGKDYKLPYTATGAFGAVDKEKGGKVAEFTTAALTDTKPQTVDVSFATDTAPAYAGDYSDPVVFTIAVETEATN